VYTIVDLTWLKLKDSQVPLRLNMRGSGPPQSVITNQEGLL
jgi:hypothetical protein